MNMYFNPQAPSIDSGSDLVERAVRSETYTV